MSTHTTHDSLSRTVLVVLGVLVLFPVLMMTVAMPMMGMMGGMGMMGDMGMMSGMDGGMAGGFSSAWAIGMMLVWLVVLLGVGYFIYRGLAGRTDAGPADSALEELRVAYARGDLTDEEFEQRRAKLRSGE
jgi:putative membrane protein